ncbi:unknown [Bacteroides fragilis CAG:558]|nr:unknown [Bacteroides fragilis CAG:558]
MEYFFIPCYGFACGNIPITGFRTPGFYSECNDGTAFIRKRECLVYYSAKFGGINHHLVRRSDHNVGIRIFLFYFPAGIRYARSRISGTGLCQYVVFRYTRQLFLNNVFIPFRCDYPHVFLRAKVAESFGCQLEQCFPTSQYIYELFGTFRCTHRPEAASYATGHNYYMIIHRWSFPFICYVCRTVSLSSLNHRPISVCQIERVRMVFVHGSSGRWFPSRVNLPGSGHQ